jgi:ATP-dependent Lon protease
MNNSSKQNKELRMQLVQLSNTVSFLKETLIDMSNNLINLHKLKIYDGLNHGYTDIVDELNNINNKLKKYPDFFKTDYLTNRNITPSKLEMELNDIITSLMVCSKYIVPSDIKSTLKLILGNNWENNFNHFELSQINLLSRLYNCISCWDNLDKHNNNLNNNEKRVVFGKETILPLIEENMKTSSIVISDISAFPLFIKNLAELVVKNKKKLKDRTTLYDYNDIIKLFDNKQDNIIYVKNENTNSNSLIEEKNGFNIILKIKTDNIKLEKLENSDNNIIIGFTRTFVFQGFAKDDTMDIYKTNNYIHYKYKLIKEYINKEFTLNNHKDNYLKVLNIRDILINTPNDILSLFKKRFNDYTILKQKQIGQCINDFLLASKYRKLEILIAFLCGDLNDNKLAFILYDILRMKDKKDVLMDVYNALPTSFKVKLDETEVYVNKDEENLIKNHMGDLSYERRINLLKVPDNIKDKAIEKLKSMKGNFQGDNKAQSWLDGFLKIPFGIYKENSLMNYKREQIKKLNNNLYSCNEITNYINNNYINNNIDINTKNDWDNYMRNKSNYLNMVHNKLDEVVYGHKEAKLQLERLFAQWLNGETKGAIIGLCGPPGTGKTSLAKNGLSKCLIDDNNNPRPFSFLPIGGSVNGSTLVGHNYTYVGSTWGRIVDILITAECMNPIIFIDEVDKISNTDYGKEIIAVLTHLTDATQNDNFEDKYFSGIPLDLSKALIVFSFNDASLLDPILKDRITIIETKPYTLQEKIHIITNYMIPEVLKEVGFSKDEIIFNEDIIKYLINTYTNEAGVRKIKEKIVEIIRDINLKYIHSYDIHNNAIKLPYTIDINYIDDIFKMKPKMKINKTHTEPMVGLVNGLYATSTGIGGLTPIQVMKYPADKMLELTITGQQGEVMKESVSYALRIAYNMLSDEEKQKILEDANNKKNFGLLVHTPEAATKKDGPSAGAAMTLAIYSVLSNKKINNKIAMTGEIDLCKNVKMIGGLHAKLSGAKAAGISLVLIPNDNLEDLNILRNDNISQEDDLFKVELIECFDDIIKLSII